MVAGYSPIEAGAALVPMTIVMLLLSARAGRLAQRIGPRLPMGLGPIVAGAGLALLTRVGPDASYVTDVLPAVLVFGLGLSVTVAPLNVTVLGSAGEERRGHRVGHQQRRRTGGGADRGGRDPRWRRGSRAMTTWCPPPSTRGSRPA